MIFIQSNGEMHIQQQKKLHFTTFFGILRLFFYSQNWIESGKINNGTAS